MSAVTRVIRMAVRRRRLQSLVVGVVVLLAAATAVLALGLLAVSDAPFDHAFARQSGAHVAATFDPGKAAVEALAATGHGPGVTAAAGPFDLVTANLDVGGRELGNATVVGRSAAGGPVDRLGLIAGGWLTGPGQIVLGRPLIGSLDGVLGGTAIVDLPGQPALRVVGVADSITGTADAWVWPSQRDVLGATAGRQMLYRFAAAGDDAALRGSLAAATRSLPADALLGSGSYLVTKLSADRSTAPVVPFVVAFALLGLVMSVLVVANVVGGAVVAGYRVIGVLKALGFTPGQVVAGYAGQVLVPAVSGALLGAVLGDLLAVPVLGQTAGAYGVASLGTVPAWVDLAVLLGLSTVVAVAAILPALRAGRLPAVQAITVGRAPRTGRGFRVRRALAGSRLPRPISFGLGTPFARPARSATTVLAVLLGATTVVFAIGLAGSLHRVAAGFTRTAAVPVEVDLAVPGSKAASGSEGSTVDPGGVLAVIRATPGTARVAAVRSVPVTVVGLSQRVMVQGYDGDSGWTGYPIITGHWPAGPDQVAAASYLLRSTGIRIGGHLTVATGTGRRTLIVVGEVFDQDYNGLTLLGGTGALTGLAQPRQPDRYEIGLVAGTDAHRYVEALSSTLPVRAGIVRARDESGTARTFAILLGLVATLTMLLAIAAALGVFNTVLLNTRERVFELGVLKSIGMTPGQVRGMVIASMAGIGVLAGALAVPAGYALHRAVLPVMAAAAGTGLPPAMLAVYRPLELVGLALAGVLLAVLGAALPAGWAAAGRAATALRAE